MKVAKNANELVTNLKATNQKLRLNFERVRSSNNELARNAEQQNALLKESKLEAEKFYKKYINERFFLDLYKITNK